MKEYTDLKRYIESLDLIDPAKIDLDTNVEADLGLTGDDAIDFIEEFSNHFDVDIDSFDFDKYFRPEGGVFLNNFFSSDGIKVREVFTLRNLMKAIMTGKLE